MGWTTTSRRPGISNYEYISDLFTAECELLEISQINYQTIVGTVILKRTAQVIAFLYSHKFTWESRGGYNYSYRIDEESAGFNVLAPLKILERLTGGGLNEFSKEWRKKSWEALGRKKVRPKFQVGDTVVFHEPLNFGRWGKTKVFTVKSTKPLEVLNAGRYPRRSTLAKGLFKILRDDKVIYDSNDPSTYEKETKRRKRKMKYEKVLDFAHVNWREEVGSSLGDFGDLINYLSAKKYIKYTFEAPRGGKYLVYNVQDKSKSEVTISSAPTARPIGRNMSAMVYQHYALSEEGVRWMKRQAVKSGLGA